MHSEITVRLKGSWVESPIVLLRKNSKLRPLDSLERSKKSLNQFYCLFSTVAVVVGLGPPNHYEKHTQNDSPPSTSFKRAARIFITSRGALTLPLHEPIILIKMFMFALRVADDEPNSMMSCLFSVTA